jgi:predicted MFS family arabinose efflux permease
MPEVERRSSQRKDVTPLMWLRTREIKPGVYETQSAGHHAARQVDIALGVLVGAVLLFSLIASPIKNLSVILILLVVGAPIAYWHRRYRKTHRDAHRERRPGPWD